MIDEDFLQALQTHMARVTRSVQQDSDFMIGLAKLATSDDKFKPMYLHYFTITQNQTEALSDLTQDIAELMKFGTTLLGLVSSSSLIKLPPPDSSIF